jgi:hypothetical protein
MLAGFICVAIHDLAIGPIAYGPNNAIHQSVKKFNKAKGLKTPTVKKRVLKR